jgi:AAA15 family ATPase/GTPase
MLVWAWEEHKRNADLLHIPVLKEMVLLIDEVEAHLHPQWQRVIVPALLSVMEKLAPSVKVQLFVTTHAPLVLASLEPHFKPDQDALWKLDLKEDNVVMEKDPWRKRGPVGNWLVSDVFDLKEDRSREAEAAIQAVEEVIREGISDPKR